MRFPLAAICKIAIYFCVIARGPLAPGATVHFPPMLRDGRHGSYDVSVERTEFAGGQEFPALIAKYHVDMGDGCVRTVVREFSLNPQPLYKVESIFAEGGGSILNIDTETGKTPSQVTFDESRGTLSDFLASGYGVAVVNGCFANRAGMLWDEIERIVHQGGGARERISVAPGVEATLLQHSPGDWRLAQVKIRATQDQQSLYGAKLYHVRPPKGSPVMVTEQLDCEYGSDDSTQSYEYEISSYFGGDEVVRVVEEITVTNYSSHVANVPISADGAYRPMIVEVPNGTPVLTDEGIDHEWKDGHIVKSIDASAVAVGKTARFATGHQLLIFNVVLLAAIISALLLRRAWEKKEPR